MPVRTKSQFFDAVASDRAWRIKEIAAFKRASAKGRGFDEEAIRRAGLALLYAHWEGFVKAAGRAYLEYIFYQRLRRSQLNRNLLVMCLREKIDSLRCSGKYSAYATVFEEVLAGHDGRVTIPYKKALSTHSNLSSAALYEILWMLGLDRSGFRTKEKFIDSRLLAKRNAIAHGKNDVLEHEEFLEVCEQVIILIDIFRSQVQNSIAQELFRLP